LNFLAEELGFIGSNVGTGWNKVRGIHGAPVVMETKVEKSK
jgi:hypothetical protein